MPSEFVSSLSEEFRNDPSLADIQDADGLAKSFIHQGKLIGQDRLPVPKDDWDDGKWNEHYERLGRPEDTSGYSSVDLNTIDDVPEGFSVDDKALDSFKEMLHANGVSKRQGDNIIKQMTMDSLSQFSEKSSKVSSDEAAMVANLQQEYGDKYQANMDIANEIISKFGGEELTNYLAESGLSRNENMVKAFVEIGKHFVNDSAKGPGDSNLNFGGPAKAQAEIQQLSGDADFLKALNDRNHIGHRTALSRWQNLHSAAYPKAS
jgi:hypothetical protein